MVAPFHPSFKNPGEHAHWRVAQSIGQSTWIEHMHSQMSSETTIERYDPVADVLRNTLGNRVSAAEIPGTITVKQTQLLCRADMDCIEFISIFMPKLPCHQG